MSLACSCVKQRYLELGDDLVGEAERDAVLVGGAEVLFEVRVVDLVAGLELAEGAGVC